VDIATFIISRVCRGLEYAHNKKDDHGQSLGLVHRDVSPNNIMITHEGEVKLTDFGVARARRFMEDDQEYLVGSVEYMSPEQANCGTVDGRSDLFSLALVYYELLTGVRVFQCRDESIEETIEMVKKARIPDPTEFRLDLPTSVVRIVLKALAQKPEERYPSAGEMGYTLENEMYSKGYGPTIVTLAKYIQELG
jgi:serine/threonine-protein kinase